jgi:hypothetical protein
MKGVLMPLNFPKKPPYKSGIAKIPEIAIIKFVPKYFTRSHDENR